MALTVDRADLLFREMMKSLEVPRWVETLKWMGLGISAYCAFKCLSSFKEGIRIHFLPRLFYSQSKFPQKYGEWAVVTGCTQGIGKAFAFELAAKGCNVVLIARNGEKLMQTSQEIERLYGVTCLLIEVDFTHPNVISNIERQLKDIDVGILVNNVSIAEIPGNFHEFSENQLHDSIKVNITTAPQLCRMVLPNMVKKRKGAIINLSSWVCDYPFPYVGLYSSTKAFTEHFSEILRYEYEDKNIDILCLTPMGVYTSMLRQIAQEDSHASFLTPLPQVYVSHAIRTLGVTNKTTGYWSHALACYISSFFPKSWISYFLITLTNKQRYLATTQVL